MQGQKFTRLTVIAEDLEAIGRKRWICKCNCGNVSSVRQDALRDGSVRSCGCLRAENSYRTHGMHKNPIYRVWGAMISRCSNINDPAWSDYGGRGIDVDEAWLKFEKFYEDMGESYEQGLTLERVDVNLGYSKVNCVWATWKDQGFNKRKLKNNKSGKTGVRWATKSNKWQARIGVDGKDISLGYFESFEEAVAAREAAELEYYGKLKGH